MDYLLKASGMVILLFLFYYVFLKNETFFKSIRTYFLIGLIIVLSLPLIEIPIYVEYVSQQIDVLNFEEINVNQISNSSLDLMIQSLKKVKKLGPMEFFVTSQDLLVEYVKMISKI